MVFFGTVPVHLNYRWVLFVFEDLYVYGPQLALSSAIFISYASIVLLSIVIFFTKKADIAIGKALSFFRKGEGRGARKAYTYGSLCELPLLVTRYSITIPVEYYLSSVPLDSVLFIINIFHS